MKTLTRRRINQAVAATALFCMATQTTFAALLNFAQAPLFIGANVPPKVMLTISKDQQLYKKAYNDYSDLDGDGNIETTYKHSISYYGYFDSSKCYGYSTANTRFEPQLPIARDASGKFTQALCNNGAATNQWSGNFLNWISMSRMDAVRKLLFGGLRISDTATDTTLERAFLPTDAHAWAKYYNPDPTKADASKLDYEPAINKLTPFNPPTTASATVQATASLLPTAGDYAIQFVSAPAGFQVGDQIRLATATGSITGPVLQIDSATRTVTVRLNAASIVGIPTGISWNVTNLSATGISFCNLTTGNASGGTDSKSQTNTRAPLIRVAQGNFALWNANERWQCQWSGEQSNLQSGFGGVRSNGNQVSLSEIAASAENPTQAVHGLGTGSAQGSIGSRGQYFARVAVCVTATTLHGSEKCLQYPSGNYKPIGLLQTYGDTQRIHFGLMTGSYSKNITGGVVRKDVGSFANEVLASTTGRFNTATSGIVKTLNSMRVYGYNYIDGSYLGSSGDNCTYQLTDITEGSCTSWGNPMSEVFFEAIRYFAGKQPTPAAQYTSSGSKDTALGLPLVTTWTDPLSANTYCAPLNVLVFNASVSTNEDDLRTRVASDINSPRTVGALTTAIGDASAEAITGGTYFAGKVLGVTAAADPGFELCTPKTITALGEVSGICPEGPTLGGSYLIAGIAHHARTNRIRTDLDGSIPASDVKALKVTSYGIQLASNTPQLTIPVAGGTKIVIQPLYRLNVGGGVGGGSLVDLKYVRTSPDMSTGKVYINWEDSEQGGDYDQDMWGTLEWSVNAVAKTITVTTNAVSASTANPQGFGYTISGTTKDGPHFPSGILGFNFTDTTGVLGCTDCQVASSATGQRGPQSITYSLGATAASTLKDPLWYLAKYGGFNDINANKLPDTLPTTEEWDKENNRTGDLTPDGEPDNYFLVTNPLGLEAALERAFRSITEIASASSVAANSTSLKTGSAIYAARFDAKDWSGRLTAYLLTADGTVETTAQWEVSTKLPAANDRVILTYNDDALVRSGVKFRWTDVGAKLKTALDINPANLVADARGQQRLDYLRGDATLEGATSSSFRRRPVSKLGDIVNSSPAFVGSIPGDPNRDTSYKAYRDTFIAAPRKPMIYVGSNDGMLHGFDATATSVGGKELLAYVPSKTHSKLNQLTNPNYIHRYFIDSTPSVADVQIGTTWKTVLVGGLAAGGQGVYALDVTDPSKFAESNTSTVLWEFNDSDDAPASGYAGYGLGYVFGQPVIRKMSNGKWAAIVSAGYNNSEADGFAGDGRGYIYIIFLNGPSGPNRTWVRNTDYVRLETTGGSIATPNGLAPPFAADVNSDGMVDFIYAGDLQGEFWKFDVTDSTNSALPGFKNAANYANSNNRTILFMGSQPITAQAQGTVHPTGQGYILTFGTGKYIEPTDATGPYTTQSFYGIWDKNNSPGKISAQTPYPTDRSKLFRQVIVASGTFRTIEPGPSQGSTSPVWTRHMGWFMDFPTASATGERSVFTPLLVSGRLIFTTLIPSGGACEFGGTSYLMVVNPITGGRFEAAVLDVNGDRVITAGDTLPSGVYASGVQSAVGITPTPTVMGGRIPDAVGSATVGADGGALVRTKGSRRGNMIFGGSSGATTDLPIGLGNDRGRVAWREVLQK